MSEENWLLIAVFVWSVCAIVAITDSISESDEWSDISTDALFISTGIMECLLVLYVH